MKILQNKACIPNLLGYFTGMNETKPMIAGERTHLITAENIDAESYYNCTRLAAILGYANPPGAIKELNLRVNVVKDAEGNILRVVDGTRSQKVWVVTAPSAYRSMHTCFLGRGATKQAALEDAYGPKESWGNNTRKSLRIADVYETDEATADELEHGSNQ
jgi:hypothetical protein